MFCTKCGKENAEGTQFCTNCGERLGKVDVSSANPSKSKKNLWGHFVGVVKKFYNLTIQGRATRAEFWGYVLFYLLFAVVAGIIDYLLFGEGDDTLLVDWYIGVFFLPYLSVAFRRMHDVGKPAWYCFIPIYGFILCLIDSDKGTNKYGPSPKEN